MPPIIRRVAKSIAPSVSTGSRATMATEISNTTPDRAGDQVGRIDVGQHAALDRGA